MMSVIILSLGENLAFKNTEMSKLSKVETLHFLPRLKSLVGQGGAH